MRCAVTHGIGNAGIKMEFDNPKILITGVTGFVGRALLERFLEDDDKRAVAVTVRDVANFTNERVIAHSIGDLELVDDWSNALRGIECVIHCAGLAHVTSESLKNPIEEYRRVNVRGTLKLAEQASTSGVKRFIFISSIKVNGEVTYPGKPFTADDEPNPIDDYGTSKMEAELGLKKISRQTGLEVVIIRPPLIYGKDVKGNLASLLKWINTGVPLPFAGIKNKRSLVSLDNLTDFVKSCVLHPAACNETFLVSDGCDISTTRLCQLCAHALNRPPRLFFISPTLISFMSISAKIKGLDRRLFGSLELDIEKNDALMNWIPTISIEKGLRDAAEKYKN